MKRIIGLMFCIIVVLSLSATAFADAGEKEAKGTNLNVAVDVGDNTKELLKDGGTELAKIIGKVVDFLKTDAPKMFPYYVKQAYITGYVYMFVWGGFEVICLIAAIVLILMANMYEKKDNDDFKTGCGVFAIIVFALFILGLVVGFFDVPGWIAMIKNPEYTAIQSVMDNASKFIGK